jgi:hypothetical protein
MNWSGKECAEWFPFVQAVAEGKSLLIWTGFMEKIEEGVEYTDNPFHRCKDEKGVEYASRKDDEWNDIGNNLPLMFGNHCMIRHPIMYLKVKED